ncbi:MAG TPA: hypothetical protein VK428_08675, partial [Acidimicrobiales bacterium]|nr:hypothetical protein [Acidimicrobiales bacterium]
MSGPGGRPYTVALMGAGDASDRAVLRPGVRGVAAIAEAEPGRTALVFGERRVSFSELDRL